VVTDPQTNTQTDRGDYNTLRRCLVRSVINGFCITDDDVNDDVDDEDVYDWLSVVYDSMAYV